MTLTLSAIMATHIWIGNHNALVRVCEYRPARNISRWYNHYPPKRYISWYSNCPLYIVVKKMK